MSELRRIGGAPVDRRRPELVFRQVYDYLTDTIRRGEFGPGDRIPAERTLARQLGVSRVSLRRALTALADDGLLEASMGSGWYVAGEKLSEPVNTLLNFTSMARSRGLTASARVLAATVRPCDFDESEVLEIAPASELFVLERVRLLDGIPIAHSVSRVPLAYAPDLPSIDFTTASLYESLEQAGIVPSHGEYEIDAQRASERLGSLLSVEQGSPVLVVSVRVLDQAGRPVELAKIAYREDAYRFRVVLSTRHGVIAASA